MVFGALDLWTVHLRLPFISPFLRLCDGGLVSGTQGRIGTIIIEYLPT